MKDSNKLLKSEDTNIDPKNANSEDDLDFKLWIEELNKDLMSFWKRLKWGYHR